LDSCFPKSARLLKSKDYKRVYDAGKRRVGRFLQLFYCPNELNRCRFGISVSKKFGKAVERNLLKRRIREGIRKNQRILTGGWDLVIHPKSLVGVQSAEQVASDLMGLLESLNTRNEIGFPKTRHSR